MLIASNYLLNMTTKKEEFELFPFIHNLSNNFTESQPYKAVKIPDVYPPDLLPKGADFSMVAGEFVEVYSKQPSMSKRCGNVCRNVGLRHHLLLHRHCQQRFAIY